MTMGSEYDPSGSSQFLLHQSRDSCGGIDCHQGERRQRTEPICSRYPRFLDSYPDDFQRPCLRVDALFPKVMACVALRWCGPGAFFWPELFELEAFGRGRCGGGGKDNEVGGPTGRPARQQLLSLVAGAGEETLWAHWSYVSAWRAEDAVGAAHPGPKIFLGVLRVVEGIWERRV